MRLFKIAAGTHRGKHIHVTRYVKTERGVDINVEHNVPAVAGKELQWVQTVYSNNGISKACGMLSRVDPFSPSRTVPLPAVPGICKADDLLPFYWTEQELADGAGPGFHDAPEGPAPDKGRIWRQFITALTEVSGKNVHHLVAIAWGYDRLAGGEVRVAVIRTPQTEEMRRHGRTLKRMYPDWTYT